MSNLCRSLCGFATWVFFSQFLIFMLCCKSSVGDHKNVAVWSSIDQLHGVSLRVFALKNCILREGSREGKFLIKNYI
jgi:hypothetical protein